jgi:hypothetical protein
VWTYARSFRELSLLWDRSAFCHEIFGLACNLTWTM